MKYSFEVVQYNENLPGRILMQDKPGWRCDTKWHWHKELEFVYMIDGTLDAKINGKDITLNNGDMYFVNSEEMHYSTAPDKQSVNKYIVVLLSYNFMRPYYKKLDSIRFDLLENEEAQKKIKPIILKIIELEQSRPSFYSLLQNACFMQIYNILLSHCITYKKNSIPMHIEDNFLYAKKAIEYIGINFMEDISLDDISSYVGLTPTYFSKYFKNITECTFIYYLNSVRLQHALNDLIYKKITVTDAAFSNGFPNVKAFISFCKKIYGCTPVKYKKNFGDI